MEATVALTPVPVPAAAGSDPLLIALIVMAALILLVGLIILKKIAGLKGAPSVSAAAPLTAAPQQWGEDPQVVAAITAAIACMLEPQTAPSAAQAGTPGFVVRRIRRL